jgi:TBC1 domain family member 14
MSFLGAMLLLTTDAPTAFQLLANLLASNIYFDFYRMDMGQMRKHLGAYEELFEANLPQLWAHFRAEGIEAEMYTLDWLLTLFSRALPLDVASRVWDIYLCEVCTMCL